VNFDRTTRRYIPEDITLHTHHYQTVKLFTKYQGNSVYALKKKDKYDISAAYMTEQAGVAAPL
jgi:hypothetical protein